MASERAYWRVEWSCSADSRTRQFSISGVKLGAAKVARMATIDTVTISSMTVKPVTKCRVRADALWRVSMAVTPWRLRGRLRLASFARFARLPQRTAG